MFLEYAGVKMETLTYDCNREAVYDDDGDTYLFHRWTINAEVVLGPDAGFVNYSTPPIAPNLKPLLDPWGREIRNIIQEERLQFPTSATTTDVNIRAHLMRPRQKLRFYEQSNLSNQNVIEYLLDLPREGDQCDCNAGPTPIAFNIRRIVGNARTIVANFQITAYERDGTYSKTDPSSVLLSNNWRETHELDADYFTTRVVEGVAHFDAAAIERLKLVIDGWRPNLAPKIPRGFRREAVTVALDEDHRRLHYSFVDVQQKATLIDGTGVGVTRAQVELQQMLTKEGDTFASILDTYSSVFEYRANRNFSREQADEDKSQQQGPGRRQRQRRRRLPPPNAPQNSNP
ncbi:hypothetical protein [Limnoglobus roseus]|uniref:Uncharacterized protein n=1 Tax=Limnoglobus roseus TaxID=2598579 RepID=A0A5C1AC18_9BACT|nr:hypothetical protein [Limnoglobus roseus]QEL16919.1 hypothetical protein PX52LOC_03895 [Limnoglobus roseus]